MMFSLPPTQVPLCLVDAADAPEAITRFITHSRDRGEVISLDTETTGTDPWRDRLVLLQLSTPQEALLIDMRTLVPETLGAWRMALLPLFQGTVLILAHNGKFDLLFLLVTFAIPPDVLKTVRIWDTMLAEQVILGGLEEADGSRLKADLASTAARYGLVLRKAPRSWFVGLDQRPEWSAPFPAEQLAYAAHDSAILHPISTFQTAEMSARDLLPTAQLEMACLPALVAMELRGIAIDIPGWRHYLQRKTQHAAQLETDLQTMLFPLYLAHCQQRYAEQVERLESWKCRKAQALAAAHQAWEDLPNETRATWGAVRTQASQRYQMLTPRPAAPKTLPRRINLGSPAQLREEFHLFGIEMPDTLDETLERYAGKHPAIAQIRAWRKLNKLITSFGETILAQVAADGRLHPRYWQIGSEESMVRSGRMSCSEPNFQQLPAHDEEEEHSIRRHVIAAPGHLLLTCDLDNIEARVAAERSQDPAMLALFARGGDMHTQTAIQMFSLPLETTKEQAKEWEYRPGISLRSAAKTINYALLFGAGPGRLATMLGCSQDDARELLDRYFATYPGVKDYLDHTATEATRLGYSRTIGERRRNFSRLPEPQRVAFDRWDAYMEARQDWRIALSRIKRQAANASIQGTAADILKLALVLTFHRLPKGAYLVAAVHDELMVEADEGVADEAAAILAKAMEEAARAYLPTVALGAFHVTQAPYWRKE